MTTWYVIDFIYLNEGKKVKLECPHKNRIISYMFQHSQLKFNHFTVCMKLQLYLSIAEFNLIPSFLFALKAREKRMTSNLVN